MLLLQNNTYIFIFGISIEITVQTVGKRAASVANVSLLFPYLNSYCKPNFKAPRKTTIYKTISPSLPSSLCF